MLISQGGKPHAFRLSINLVLLINFVSNYVLITLST